MNRRHVVVETEGRHTYGMTVADLRPWANPADANVTVVERADSESCVETILRALTKT
jgi:inosine-uridine nucleoside N-ribohydrolase